MPSRGQNSLYAHRLQNTQHKHQYPYHIEYATIETTVRQSSGCLSKRVTGGINSCMN